jgi:DNA-binding response OmpR family regulator
MRLRDSPLLHKHQLESLAAREMRVWNYLSPAASGTAAALLRGSPFLTMNFLVVDDNRLLNRFLTTYLRGKGHSASSLTDSSKVESWLDLNPCDGVILDIGMPKIDGLSLISMIRAKYADLPIVMFTGLGYDEDAMQAARKAGANGYVSKGLGPSEIYSALMRVLSQHHATAAH